MNTRDEDHQMKNIDKALQSARKGSFIACYPASWAEGIDIEKLKKADTETIRAVLVSAVQDGINVTNTPLDRFSKD